MNRKNDRIPNSMLPDGGVTLGDEPDHWIECPWCDHKSATQDQLDQHLMDTSGVWPHPEIREEHLEPVEALLKCSCGEEVESGESVLDHSQQPGEHEIVALVEMLE